MRFIHTADWHLGRLLYGASLLEDQSIVLDELCQLANDVRPDAVLVSGDVYDRAFPPPEAVALLDETLSRLVMDVRTTVVVIAGNHDSPERIGFASRVLSRAGLHVAGPVVAEPRSVVIPGADGPVRVWALPYADPPHVAQVLEDPSIRGHETAMSAMLTRIRIACTPRERAVLVGHAFVTGGSESESERPLSVGGSGQVPASVFRGFDYVALGHLHRPQTVRGERIRYSGSLLKYSFQEADHRKSVSVVELGPGDRVGIEEVELHARRDVRTIRGTLAELLTAPPTGGREDYLWADLTDDLPVYDAVERLRAVYPNVLHAARVSSSPAEQQRGFGVEDVRRLGMPELFGMFFRDVTSEGLDVTQQELLAELVREFERERRGA
jgi:DNA repair protein SbcD/Mre11